MTRHQREAQPPKRDREAGQAMVETAIVMPLMVFLLLGLMQMNLLYQNRLVAEYAAYRAVRAGALGHAKVDKMETAAIAALLPTMVRPDNRAAVVVNSGTDYATKFVALQGANNLGGAVGVKMAEVTICGPLKADLENKYFKTRPLAGGGARNYDIRDVDLDGTEDGQVDFDDPRRISSAVDRRVASSTSDEEAQIAAFKRGKLRIQLTYNYIMPIPFANQVIHRIWLGQQLVETLRLKPKGLIPVPGAVADVPTNTGVRDLVALTTAATAMKMYVLPIRTEYNMRMQSNLFVNELPTANNCLTYADF